jgi:hypothetical protein
MNTCYVFVVVPLLAASLLSTRQAPEYTSPPELQATLEAHEKAIQPGTQHIDLMRFAGEYTTKESLYLPGTDKPQVSDGFATIKSEMGGRFLVEHNDGSLMGEPYTGVRIYGYNNGSKQYEGVWTYSGSTGVRLLSGSSKDEGKTIDFIANFRDDAAGLPRTMSVTLKLLDPDHFEVEVKGTLPNGSQGTQLVTVYTRKS